MQQPLVAGEMIEHAEQEVRFARGVTQRLGADAGQRQEPVQLFGVLGQEGEGLNRHRFGRISRHLWALCHVQPVCVSVRNQN